MRMQIVKFEGLLQPFYGLYMTRGEDPETNKKAIPMLQAFNKLIEDADGKCLFGTPQPTMLDVMFLPFLETLSDWQHTAYGNIHEDCDYKTHGSLIDGYVARMRAHPLIHPERMRTGAAVAHTARSRSWVKGQKCQLWTGYLEEVFAADE